MNPVTRRVHVRVPATSANLGSGFDTVGLALDYHDELTFTLSDDPADTDAHVNIEGEGAQTLPRDETHLVVSTFRRALDYHDELTFTLSDDPADTDAHVNIEGEGAQTLPRDETHLVVSTFRRACRTFGLGRLGFTLEAHNRIPQARGMGSSAEAIVAGIAAAAAFAQEGELNRSAIFDLAATIEGHPDNVAPAVFGGLTVSWDFSTAEGVGSVPIPGGEPLHGFDLAATIEGHPDNVAPAVFGGLTVSWDFSTAEGVGSVPIPGGEPLHGGFHTVNYPVDPAITAAVFVPDYELSTEKARQALPATLPYRDAVYNVSRVGLLPAAMNPGALASTTTSSDGSATEKARQALPATLPYRDAVYNVSRVGLLPAAMNPGALASTTTSSDGSDADGGIAASAASPALAATANTLLYTATQDKLHQPYRAALMEPSWNLIERFRSHGYAAAVSGAGPCVLVLHYGDARGAIDAIAAEDLASGHWRVLHLPIDTTGVTVERG